MTNDELDPSARVTRNEVEVTATPEAVWRAIATGPGIATWFVPAEVEEHEGGAIRTDHGPFGVSEGVVTVWDPPHRFVYEERGWNPDAPEAPPWATEILVEARAGGTCVVRLVSGFFADGEGWEEHLAGTDEGWAAGLANLRLALTHFPGLPAARLFVIGQAPGDVDEVRTAVLAALGLDGARPGDRVRLTGDAPPAAGVVEEVTTHEVLLRVDEPGPGLLEIGVIDYDGVHAAVRGYWYGDGGAAIAARDEPRWTAWLAAHLDGFTPVTGLDTGS